MGGKGVSVLWWREKLLEDFYQCVTFSPDGCSPFLYIGEPYQSATPMGVFSDQVIIKWNPTLTPSDHLYNSWTEDSVFNPIYNQLCSLLSFFLFLRQESVTWKPWSNPNQGGSVIIIFSLPHFNWSSLSVWSLFFSLSQWRIPGWVQNKPNQSGPHPLLNNPLEPWRSFTFSG